MIAWAQGWVPQGLGVEAAAADPRLLHSAQPAPTCASPHIDCVCVCILKISPTTQTSLY